jgi:outer membrane lipase/esterase
LGYGQIDDSNIHRSFMLGSFPDTLTAHTTGDHYDADITTGYNVELLNHQIKTGPIASLEYQRVSINPYIETSSNFESEDGAFDAMQYHCQNYDSFVGGLGWQINYTGTINNVKVMPYLQATYNHEMINDNIVEAGVTSLPGSNFSLPVGLPFKDYGLFSGGIQTEFKNGLVMSLGYNAMAGNKYLSQNVMLNLSLPF